MQPSLTLSLDPAAFDPDIRCPHCNGPCVTDTESWTSACTCCAWTTSYDDPEDAFLVEGFSLEGHGIDSYVDPEMVDF